MLFRDLKTDDQFKFEDIQYQKNEDGITACVISDFEFDPSMPVTPLTMEE